MDNYWPFGPKADEYKEYQKIKFLQHNLEGITEDEVDEYSVTLGKIHKWLLLAIQLRI